MRLTAAGVFSEPPGFRVGSFLRLVVGAGATCPVGGRIPATISVRRDFVL
jgi:hypothetical protein